MMSAYGMTGSLGFGWVFMVLFWVLIIVGIVALVKWMGTSSSAGGRSGSGSESKALDILKARFASGEIDEQEFQKRKREVAQ